MGLWYGLEESVSLMRGLSYSTISILISLALSIAIVAVPVVVGLFVKLPGQMPIAQNSSAVISAACHCVAPDYLGFHSGRSSSTSRPDIGGMGIATPGVDGVDNTPRTSPTGQNHPHTRDGSLSSTLTEATDKPLLLATRGGEKSPLPIVDITEYTGALTVDDGIEAGDKGGGVLWELVTGRLKWGVVSPDWEPGETSGSGGGRIYTEREPGHLAFGGPEQEVEEPVEGSYYA